MFILVLEFVAWSEVKMHEEMHRDVWKKQLVCNKLYMSVNQYEEQMFNKLTCHIIKCIIKLKEEIQLCSSFLHKQILGDYFQICPRTMTLSLVHVILKNLIMSLFIRFSTFTYFSSNFCQHYNILSSTLGSLNHFILVPINQVSCRIVATQLQCFKSYGIKVKMHILSKYLSL